MKCLLYTYILGKYDDIELRNDIYELNRILIESNKNKLTKEDWDWCKENHTKYECNKIDIDNIDLGHNKRVRYEFNPKGYFLSINFLNKNGKSDGKGTFYHENGNISHEENYQDGILEGKETRYYESGDIYYVVNYKNGKREGNFTHYSSKDKILVVEIFSEDKLIGRGD